MIDSNETVMYENGRDLGYSKGYSEGYEDGIKSKIETITPHPTEAIALFFDMEILPLDQLSNIFELVHSKFPDNKVIALPNNVSLESCSKDVLENFISMITEIIEQL